MKKRNDYSYSALNIYDSICHKQYYFEYLDPYASHWENKKRIKQVQIEAGRRKELIFGGIIHDVLTDFFHLPQDKRNLDSIKEILKSRWRGPRGAKRGFPDIETEREQYQKALKMLKGFVGKTNLAPQIAYLPKPKKKDDEFVKENYFKVDIGDGLLLTGIIDRIDKETEGYHLIDYKTGKEKRKENDFQLMVYAILARGTLGMPLAKASYFYPKNAKFVTFTPTLETEDKTIKKIKEAIDAIRKDEEFEPDPSKMCYYCDFVELCPAKEEARKYIADFKGEKDDLPF
ncbi:MAG TPA: PD-(D/E)XK nuclease family protein [candidate division WWE3 bacterium]|uniref:PD-(D/E)XK nuclease family protein n=1 Tax=candidate division WWE3 bacterium TaxID=2053526 RepID=A0A7C1T2U1_UNCKA|nr:PD-(D/E)XK nuclease family protein [candidate division WWE3 bacterium]